MPMKEPREEKAGTLAEDILKLAEEIFREKFRLIPADERDKLRDRTFLTEYVRELRSVQSEFKTTLKDYSAKCRGILNKHDVKDEMFLRGDRGGVPSFLKMIEDAVARSMETSHSHSEPGSGITTGLDIKGRTFTSIEIGSG